MTHVKNVAVSTNHKSASIPHTCALLVFCGVWRRAKRARAESAIEHTQQERFVSVALSSAMSHAFMDRIMKDDANGNQAPITLVSPPPLGRRGQSQTEEDKRRRSSARRASTLELWMLKNMAKEVGTMGTLAHRVVVKMEKVAQKLKADSDDDADDEDEDLDLMEDALLEQLCTPAEDRTDVNVDQICGVLHRYVPTFARQLIDSSLRTVAKGLLYHFFQPGSVVCQEAENTNFFFLVLRGSVTLTERIVHHQERTTDSSKDKHDRDLSTLSTRQRVIQAGEHFNHFPLVTDSPNYGFAARVDDPQGASIALIPKEEYTLCLKKLVVDEVSRTVELLRDTQFFSAWTERAMWRLYFWFQRKTVGADEDIVRQGETASFCFIILSGRCTVLIPEQVHNAPSLQTLHESDGQSDAEEGEEEQTDSDPSPRGAEGRALSSSESSFSMTKRHAASDGVYQPTSVDGGSGSSTRRNSVLPVQQQVQPRRGSVMPAQKEANPRRGSVMPAQKEANPRRGSVMPAQKEANARRGSVMPAQNEANPRRGSVMPTQNEANPRRGSVVPSNGDPTLLPGLEPDNAVGAFQPQRRSRESHESFREMESIADDEESESSSEESSDDEDMDEEERKFAVAKRAADKAARVAEKAAEKAEKAFEAASFKLSEKEEEREAEEEQQDSSWTARWKRAKDKEKRLAAFEKVANEKKSAAEAAAKAAADASEVARKIQQEAEAASYRRRQSLLQQALEDQMESLKSGKALPETRRLSASEIGWRVPPSDSKSGRKQSTASGKAQVGFRERAGSVVTVGAGNMRHVVTLYPGAIVGEIALFQEGARRMATVRASEHVDLLVLSKQSFYNLDKATLTIIYENARYNAACAKKASDRTREDLRVLQHRTSVLTHFSTLDEEVHLELCRVMTYRKVTENTILVRKGMTVNNLLVVISGSVACFVTDPSKVTESRNTSLNIMAGNASGSFRGRRRETNIGSSFAGMKPSETLYAGQAIGEQELLEDDATHMITAVATETVELMEIDRFDFDRILKSDRTSARGALMAFLAKMSCMKDVSISAINGLTNVATRRTFKLNDLCVAFPPTPALGVASYSPEFVYLLYSGEMKLVGSTAGQSAPKSVTNNQPTDRSKVVGPLADEHPMTVMVEKHLGSHLAVATLGPGELIIDSLLPPNACCRWCLQPASDTAELVIFPRKEWSEVLRPRTLNELHELSLLKQDFFRSQLDQALVLKSLITPPPLTLVSALKQHQTSMKQLKQTNLTPGATIKSPPGYGHGVFVPPPPRGVLGPPAAIKRSKSDLSGTLPSAFGLSGTVPNLDCLTKPWHEELGLVW